MGNGCKFKTMELDDSIVEERTRQRTIRKSKPPKIFHKKYKIKEEVTTDQFVYSDNSLAASLLEVVRLSYANLDEIEPNQFVIPVKIKLQQKVNKQVAPFCVQSLQNYEIKKSNSSSSIQSQNSGVRLKSSFRSLSNYSRINSPNFSQKSVHWSIPSNTSEQLFFQSQHSRKHELF